MRATSIRLAARARRVCVACIPLAALAFSPSIAAEGARVGILFPDTPAARAPLLAALENGLRALGHDPGNTLTLDVRYANGDPQRLKQYAGELAASRAAVIVAAGTGPADAVRAAAPSQPILFIGVGDPLRRGYVADLRRPGGNMTGSADAIPAAAELRIALLAEALPALRDVAVISNASITPRAPMDRAAAARGLRVLHLDLRRAADFEAIYAQLERERPQALIVVPNPLTFAERKRLAEFCRRERIATLFGWREFMDAGGLMSLGANLEKLYAASAAQLDRLLKGVSPAEIAVESPQFELVVDLRTARAIGVEVPRAIIDRADRVLE